MGSRTSRADEKRNKRKRKKEKKKFNPFRRLTKKQKRILLIILLVLFFLMFTYGRKIIKLKIEQRELKQQHEELIEEQSKKTKELKNANSEDYVKEQARKKLRLLEKDEILFQFEDEDEDEDGEN